VQQACRLWHCDRTIAVHSDGTCCCLPSASGTHLDKGDDDNGVVTTSLLGEVDGADLLVGTHKHLYKLAYGPHVRAGCQT
jgi:hypothetical protein